MRNFHSSVNSKNVIGVFMSRESKDYMRYEDIIWKQFQNELPVDERRASPSEWRVIVDFRRWTKALRNSAKKDINAESTTNGAFVYTNLNTGAITVFVAWGGYDDYAVRYYDGALPGPQKQSKEFLLDWLPVSFEFTPNWYETVEGKSALIAQSARNFRIVAKKMFPGLRPSELTDQQACIVRTKLVDAAREDFKTAEALRRELARVTWGDLS
jgi:hypothetical protein